MKKREKILILIIVILLAVIVSMYIRNSLNSNSIKNQESKNFMASQTSEENSYVSTATHLAEVNQKNQELIDLNTQISQTTVTANKILNGYTAYKNGQIITGTMRNNGSWKSTPTTGTRITIPEGYHDGTGYVDTTSVNNNVYNEIVMAQNLTLIKSGKAGGSVNISGEIPAGYSYAVVVGQFTNNYSASFKVESSTGETVERISTNTQTVTDVYANCLRVWLIKFDNTNTSHTVTAKVTASSSASKTYGAHAMIFAY